MGKKIALLAVLLVVVVGGVAFGAKMLGYFPGDVRPSEFSATFISDAMKPESVPLTLEAVAENLYVPWSIVFTSPERMLISERSGQIREIENGQLASEPVFVFPEVSESDEEGLMSLVLDPDYSTNKWLYAAVAEGAGEDIAVRVVKLLDGDGGMQEVATVIDDIPAAKYHAGTDLKFGPDGKLYISTGDATDRKIAQDLESLGGKILRLNADGSIPDDNPFPGSPVFSLGHRNPQGLAFHPESGLLYSTEHGPSVFDGPAGGDEINLIERGANYGWPEVSHNRKQEGMNDPLYVYTPAIAPASAAFYDSDVIPQFKGHFLFGALMGAALFDIQFDENNPKVILSSMKVPDIEVGRIRDVAVGPDGYVYFTTSNTDGRGKEQSGDDKIYRLRPR